MAAAPRKVPEERENSYQTWKTRSLHLQQKAFLFLKTDPSPYRPAGGTTIREFKTKTKLNWKQIFFFSFVCANSSFPATFLREKSPFPLHSQSLPPPSLLCMTTLSLYTEWMKTLSGQSRIQNQDLRNVSKADGDQGWRGKPEERT